VFRVLGRGERGRRSIGQFVSRAAGWPADGGV
jgi:hypothetical protein